MTLQLTYAIACGSVPETKCIIRRHVTLGPRYDPTVGELDSACNGVRIPRGLVSTGPPQPPPPGARGAATLSRSAPALTTLGGLRHRAVVSVPRELQQDLVRHPLLKPPHLGTGESSLLVAHSGSPRRRMCALTHEGSPNLHGVIACRHAWPRRCSRRTVATPCLRSAACLGGVGRDPCTADPRGPRLRPVEVGDSGARAPNPPGCEVVRHALAQRIPPESAFARHSSAATPSAAWEARRSSGGCGSWSWVVRENGEFRGGLRSYRARRVTRHTDGGPRCAPPSNAGGAPRGRWHDPVCCGIHDAPSSIPPTP